MLNDEKDHKTPQTLLFLNCLAHIIKKIITHPIKIIFDPPNQMIEANEKGIDLDLFHFV